MKINYAKSTGAIKPMNAVNNGPVYKFAEDQRVTNLEPYRSARIPYARTHDASYNPVYGGEHCVDVIAIFPNFDSDPTDPASYDFQLTDEYLRAIEFAGTKVFYRLGNKIEHWPKKYGTLPPKDFQKWAVICEHIIRHYTEGWADGFHMDIEYWEIWNEPDLDPDDAKHKRCWGGTKAQFFELYAVASRHLKACFPHLKIGGPALAHDLAWADEFLGYVVENQLPLDFFSWHIYANDPADIVERAKYVRRMLDDHGLQKTESILNEWNYVRGWTDNDWIYTLRTDKNVKGAAFIAATMCACQDIPLDMLMYYDARPCCMNGLFSTDLVCDLLKGYYPIYVWGKLAALGNAVETIVEEDHIYAASAEKDGEACTMISYFTDDDDQPAQVLTISISGSTSKSFDVYVLDSKRDLTYTRKVSPSGGVIRLTIPSNTVAVLQSHTDILAGEVLHK